MSAKTLKLCPIICGVMIVFVLNSCKKDSNNPQNSITSTSTDDVLKAGQQRLLLQPGPGEGDDAFVDFRSYDADAANTNFNYFPQLIMDVWTNLSRPLKHRSYIKFQGLSAIPSTATVISAKLYLYGVDTSTWAPQGNTIYPGSVFNSSYPNNGCYIQRVTGGDWDESGITWNNAPNATPTDEAAIPSSNSKWNYDVKIDVSTMVRKMVRLEKNYGFCIKLVNENYYRSMLFSTSESADASKRPKLVIIYQ